MCINEFTQEKSHIYAINVGRLSPIGQISSHIRKLIQEKKLIYVLNVERPSLRGQT